MISLHKENASAAHLGPENGIDFPRELSAWGDKLDGYATNILHRRKDDTQMLGWIDLPTENDAVKPITDYAQTQQGNYSDLVVLGIGGSSLGALCVITALQHPYRNLQTSGSGLRVHFVDNVDPDVIAGLMDALDPHSTLVNVISKSGSTAETMAAYLAFKKWLQDGVGEGYRQQIVATTDPDSGILRPLAEREGYQTFTVPPTVGGRFSVLSAVGLLPIALAGIDLAALLEGADSANATLRKPAAENPIKQAALIQYLTYRRGKPISVLMPYSTRLRYLSDWYVQLWAESLGKAVNRDGSLVHEGSTPLAALGTTDQHSQVQLFNEGPNNKIIAFVRLERFEHETLIPNSEPGMSELQYLAGKTFNQLINAEQVATAHAIAAHGRPNYTLSLPELSARTLGELLQFLMWQTALMGELTYIDTFNQPGVELGKRYTYALMGREGYEGLRHELEQAGVGPSRNED